MLPTGGPSPLAPGSPCLLHRLRLEQRCILILHRHPARTRPLATPLAHHARPFPSKRPLVFSRRGNKTVAPQQRPKNAWRLFPCGAGTPGRACRHRLPRARRRRLTAPTAVLAIAASRHVLAAASPNSEWNRQCERCQHLADPASERSRSTPPSKATATNISRPSNSEWNRPSNLPAAPRKY